MPTLAGVGVTRENQDEEHNDLKEKAETENKIQARGIEVRSKQITGEYTEACERERERERNVRPKRLVE